MFQDLPPVILPLVLEKLDFEDFANAFKIWMHHKSGEVRANVLSTMDLCSYFRRGLWSGQLRPFINYATHLGVHDAMHYDPARHLACNTGDKETALELLETLSNQGHLRSKFSLNFFSVLYCVGDQELAIQNLISLLHGGITACKVNRWLKDLHVLKDGSFVHDLRKFHGICKDVDTGSANHLKSFSWPLYAMDIDKIECYRCKVKLFVFDFCYNWYGF